MSYIKELETRVKETVFKISELETLQSKSKHKEEYDKEILLYIEILTDLNKNIELESLVTILDKIHRHIIKKGINIEKNKDLNIVKKYIEISNKIDIINASKRRI